MIAYIQKYAGMSSLVTVIILKFGLLVYNIELVLLSLGCLQPAIYSQRNSRIFCAYNEAPTQLNHTYYA